jgi:hypothetical protein
MPVELAELKTKPWMHLPEEDVRDVLLPKGFIGEEERRSYHYLARYCTSGHGAIVDAGACLGASAYCFSSGLNKNPNKGTALVHSYDRFTVGEDYVAELISQHFRASKGGDDFYDIFEFQTGRYKELILSHKGDFLAERWGGGPIDILFVDLAKSLALHDHIVEQFYTAMKPSESLLMHQDFYHCWNPWMHEGMQYLSDRFEVLDKFIPSNSRLFFVKDQITAGDVEAVRSFSREQRLDLMDAFIDGESGDQRAMARVSKMCQLWLDKDVRGYESERSRLVSEAGWRLDTAWGYQANQLDGHIAAMCA